MEGKTIFIPAEHAVQIKTIQADIEKKYPANMADGVAGGEPVRDEKNRFKVWIADPNMAFVLASYLKREYGIDVEEE